MSKSERAKQFMPFDALKGLQEALRIKESEHEKIELYEVSEDDAKQISNTLLNLKNRDFVGLTFFDRGHIKALEGSVKLAFNEGKIFVDGEAVELQAILSIAKKEKNE